MFQMHLLSVQIQWMICSILYKMTVTDQIKTLNRKIKQNEAQYDLDKEAA